MITHQALYWVLMGEMGMRYKDDYDTSQTFQKLQSVKKDSHQKGSSTEDSRNRESFDLVQTQNLSLGIEADRPGNVHQCPL